MDLWDILYILLENYVPNEIILSIKDIYGNNFRGLLLFTIEMYKIVSHVKHLQGYRMGSEEINIVCYAYDIALIADTEDDLQILLYNFHLVSLKFNMKISIT